MTRFLAVHNEVSDLYGLQDVPGAEKIKMYTGSSLNSFMTVMLKAAQGTRGFSGPEKMPDVFMVWANYLTFACAAAPTISAAEVCGWVVSWCSCPAGPIHTAPLVRNYSRRGTAYVMFEPITYSRSPVYCLGGSDSSFHLVSNVRVSISQILSSQLGLRSDRPSFPSARQLFKCTIPFIRYPLLPQHAEMS